MQKLYHILLVVVSILNMRYMCVAGFERMEHTHRTNKTKVSKTRTAVLDGEVEKQKVKVDFIRWLMKLKHFWEFRISKTINLNKNFSCHLKCNINAQT